MEQTSKYRVLVLVPAGQGGVRRLFEQLREHTMSDELDWDEFTSSESGNSPLAFVRRLRSFKHALRSGRYDLVHVNVASNGSTYRKIAYARICRKLGIPYVIHLHGGAYPKFFASLPKPIKRIILKMFREAKGVLALGGNWADFVTGVLRVPAAHVRVVQNAVYAPSVPVPPRPLSAEPRLLFTGKLGEPKGLPELLAALSAPEVLTLPWKAVIAGNGEVERFQQEASQLGLDERIEFPGWVDSKNVDRYLSSSDIFLLPSRTENLPLSLLEAMGYGLFPIATDVGAVSEVIEDGRNGLLIPPQNIDALKTALVDALGDPELIRRCAAQGRSDFETSFNIQRYPHALATAYASFGAPHQQH